MLLDKGRSFKTIGFMLHWYWYKHTLAFVHHLKDYSHKWHSWCQPWLDCNEVNIFIDWLIVLSLNSINQSDCLPHYSPINFDIRRVTCGAKVSWCYQRVRVLLSHRSKFSHTCFHLCCLCRALWSDHQFSIYNLLNHSMCLKCRSTYCLDSLCNIFQCGCASVPFVYNLKSYLNTVSLLK